MTDGWAGVLASFANATATIEREAVTGTTTDRHGSEIDVTDWQATVEDAPARYEPQQTRSAAAGGFMDTQHGDLADREDALYLDGEYAGDVAAGDRVEITYHGNVETWRVESFDHVTIDAADPGVCVLDLGKYGDGGGP